MLAAFKAVPTVELNVRLKLSLYSISIDEASDDEIV